MKSTPNNNVEDLPQTAWHVFSADKVLQAISSSTGGLTTDEVARRLLQYGPNRLPAPSKRHPLTQFFNQFNNVLIYVLLCAAVVTAVLADWVDAVVIVGVVLINAIIGFIQEGEAEKAVDAIRQILSHEALIIRDGGKISVQVEGFGARECGVPPIRR